MNVLRENTAGLLTSSVDVALWLACALCIAAWALGEALMLMVFWWAWGEDLNAYVKWRKLRKRHKTELDKR